MICYRVSSDGRFRLIPHLDVTSSRPAAVREPLGLAAMIQFYENYDTTITQLEVYAGAACGRR
jgi:hypothetical protein